MKTTICIMLGAALAMTSIAHAQAELTQIHQDFSKDPGWEWKNNRIVANDPPTIKQDFGWAPSNYTGAGPGELGGMMWRSRTPAWYALPLNKPLSFKDKFSFSCRIAFLPSGRGATGGRGTSYIGFFNHELQGWRVWNSAAVRLDGSKECGTTRFGADAMNALWHGQGGAEGFIGVPADGKPHTLRFSYDPDVLPAKWPDQRLRNYVNGERRTAKQILETAHKDEPDLSLAQLQERLVDAYAEGLLTYLDRRSGMSNGMTGEFWFYKGDKSEANRRGAMMLQVDDGRTFKMFIGNTAQQEPAAMDRFGLFNFQLYHQYLEFYVSDLTVNGHKVDLSKDPGWEGHGNRVQFVERDFHREDFGYSETNWAGAGIGEIGGQFSGIEIIDPYSGYYVDDVGKLTLDDPISFSGNVCFVNDSTDAGMQIGYFNSKDVGADLRKREKRVRTITNSMGIFIEGSAHGGKRFMPQATSSKDTMSSKSGIPFNPTRERHAFKFAYDPKANNNLGRLTVTLDDKTVSLDLTEQQRSEGIDFDRFGVANPRGGGKYVVMYYDDLTYTVRRPKDYQPVFHKQEVTTVPYPEDGRKY